MVDQHGADLAAIVMEPTRSVDPLPGYLAQVREVATRAGARAGTARPVSFTGV